jgi:hypothetical protein
VLVAKVLPESQPGGATATAAKPKCDETLAFVMSQKFITDRLKAPATADFPWKSSDGVTVKDLGGCAFNVSAYVDAQNSFGANIRTRYSMNIRYQQSDDTWNASNISMAE